MSRFLITAIASIGLMASATTPASAPACRDGKGKFIRCPPAGPAKPMKFKDAKGKFAKCGSLGAKPV